MKKIIALILCIVMVLSIGFVASASSAAPKTIQIHGIVLDVPSGLDAQLTELGYVFTSDKTLEDLLVLAFPYDEQDQIHTIEYNFNTMKLSYMSESAIEAKHNHFLNADKTVDVYDMKETETEKRLTKAGTEYFECNNSYKMFVEEINSAAAFYGYMVHFRLDGYEYTFAITGLEEKGFNNKDAFIDMLKSIRKVENNRSDDANTDSIKIVINGDRVVPDSAPVIVNDRTLVPIRAVAEKLHYLVDWDNSESAALVSGNDSIIKIAIGASEMEKITHSFVDGTFETKIERIPLDAQAQIINDRTYLPLRAVSEALGCHVDWDNDTRTVIITSNS